MADVFTVTALNRYVKTLLDADDTLFDLALCGEVANFVQNARSGHCYFSLRDGQASVKAVMFRQDARRLAFRPEEGMHVIVRCRVTLYERDGAYQVYVTDMFPDGIGSAQLALEQLKQKLYAEGLFAAEHKQALPQQPKCIGLVTSKTGAALQDIRNVLTRRWPLVKLLLYPVSVQGFEAAEQVAAGIDYLGKVKKVEVIIVARGGGSKEDLWVFNAEAIARAAFRCPKPLISAIGHEIDTTILDYVADFRAPTPSAAAEVAVPDQMEIRQQLCTLEKNIQENMQSRMAMWYNKFAELAMQVAENPCAEAIVQKQDVLSTLAEELQKSVKQSLHRKQEWLAHCAALTDSLSPYRVLARGYALVQNEKGNCIKVEQVKAGEHIQVAGATKILRCLVEDTEEQKHEATQKL